MRRHLTHPLVVAGLTSVLALGTVGCSSSSTSTTEITTTDEDGNTTTTTTTTTTDENGNETTETSTVKTDASGNVIENADETPDADDFNGYTNDYYKIGIELPDGFESVQYTDELPDDMIVDFNIEKGTDATASVVLVAGATDQEGVTDSQSWAEAVGEANVSAFEEEGVQVETEVADFSLKDIPYGYVCMVSGTSDDDAFYRDLYCIVDEDGDGMIIQFDADNEDDLTTLRNSLRAL